jgi:hypothetical protein
MNMAQVKEFVCLEKRKRDLDAELKKVKQQLEDLSDALVPQFLNNGIDKVTADGRTVKIVQQVVASPVNGGFEVVAALKASELGQYVGENYNDQSIRGYVNEVAREVADRAAREERLYTEEEVRAALPEPLGRAVKIHFIHKVSSTKA